MNVKNTVTNLVMVLSASIFFGCVSGAHLTRYKKSGGSEVVTKNRGLNQPDRVELETENEQTFALFDRPVLKKKAQSNPATIYPINEQTFRFQLNDEKVWSAALDVLMQDYNLLVVDRKSGVISTEWDSFYLDKKIFRNKISVRITRKSWGQANLTIVNKIETLREGLAQSADDAIWIPTKDSKSEPARIIQSMALVLQQPQPNLPPQMKVSLDLSKKNGDSF
jgi:hypothetical protein